MGDLGFCFVLFFCLGECVRAFMYCLPVLCIDGTFLTGRYKGIVEFIMYGCTRYFRERYQAAVVLLNDP